MARLISTIYDPAQTTISMVIRLTIQGRDTDVAVIAQEGELTAIAVADGRSDWGTDDCRNFAATSIGISVM